MNQVLYEGKWFFSFPDNRIERRDGKLLWKFHHILNFRVDCYCGVNTGCLIYQILWKILMMMQLNKHYDMFTEEEEPGYWGVRENIYYIFNE